MKKEVLILFLAILILISFANSNENKIENKVIEEINKNNSAKVIIEYSNKSYGIFNLFSKNEDLPIEEEKIKHKFQNKVSANISKSDLEKLESKNNVESVTIVGKKSLFLTDSVNIVNATNSWNTKISGTNLTGINETVCILDSGADFSHPDLQGKNSTCVIDCTTSGCPENCSVSDDNGHGTHVAGIVGANGKLEGVAKGANLISVKVCTGNTCSDDDIIAGIDWCVTNQNTYDISVISMSLGGGQYDNYCDSTPPENNFVSSINSAISKNISVIASTGNTDPTFTNATAGIASPSCIENVTRVTATDDSDNMASFAFRHQNFPDILTAPGVSINSTYLNNGYNKISGTSMSAPHVAASFAIINQFKKLERNKTLTKNEIKNSLINNSKKVFDSSTNTNYSRIDIYTSILSLDETLPNVTLVSPINSALNLNQTFTCNSTDNLQLKNLTLQIWNSTDLFYENTTNTSSSSLEITENVSLNSGTYTWNCLAQDFAENSNSSTNITLSTEITTLLNSPINNTKTNQNQTYTCTSYTSADLTNVTFHLWNETNNLINTTTKNISGITNSSNFDYNFTEQGNYSWNCLTFDNESNSSFATNNYSITYDLTKPNINLVSPENSSSQPSGDINFQYNVTDNLEMKSCSLLIDESFTKSNESGITNSTNTITHSLSTGTYDWNINCTDQANNTNTSLTRTITLTAKSPSGGGGSSGGGSPSTNAPSSSSSTSLNEETLEEGTTNTLSQGDKLNLEIKNNSYEFEINLIENNEIIFSVGNQLNILIGINQARKLNLNDDNFYDLEIILINATNIQAEIMLMQIKEEIGTKKLFEGNETNQTSKEPIEEKESKSFFRKIGEFFSRIWEWIFG